MSKLGKEREETFLNLAQGIQKCVNDMVKLGMDEDDMIVMIDPLTQAMYEEEHGMPLKFVRSVPVFKDDRIPPHSLYVLMRDNLPEGMEWPRTDQP